MNDIKIENFEGPLDLLLHLLKTSKMDIANLKIADITNKYLLYLDTMKELNLDIASEYLVMASELIEMKSKSLLPNEKEENADEYLENPEEQLKKRLLEYKKYKEQTKKFKELEYTRRQYLTRLPENVHNYSDEKIVNNNETSIYDLMEAFKNLLERKKNSKPLNTVITNKDYSIKDRIKSVRMILSSKKRVEFDELFTQFDKPFLIVTFMSILEMAKLKEISIIQEENFKKIFIERVGD